MLNTLLCLLSTQPRCMRKCCESIAFRNPSAAYRVRHISHTRRPIGQPEVEMHASQLTVAHSVERELLLRQRCLLL